MPREGYKMTELGEIPKEWEVVNIEDISEIKMGQSPPSSSYNSNGIGLPFFQGNADFGSKYPNMRLYCKDPIKIADIGNILISVRAPVGDLNISNVKCCIGRGLAAIKANQNIHQIFVYYLLQTLTETLNKFATGSTFTAVNQKELKSLRVIRPSYPEQHRIASILSTLDETIEHTEALIEKYRNIKKGLMADLLTRGIDENGRIRSEETHRFKDSPLGRIPEEWEVNSIENFLTKIIDYRGKTPDKTEWGVPLLTAKNVRECFLVEEPKEFIAAEDYDMWMTRGIPDPGDVMFTTEAPLGNVALIPHGKIALAQRIIVLCPNKLKLLGKFLLYALMFPKNKTNIELKSTGSTVVGVKQSEFRKIHFSIPFLQEQQRIVEILIASDERLEKEIAYLNKLLQLKKGLMQDLLTGRVRVNKYNSDEYNV